MTNPNENPAFAEAMTNEAAKQESKEAKQKRGHNVTIRNIWQRHSQKMSGEVFNAARTGISTSAISAGGIERAQKLGETFQASQHGAKGYKSDSKRTEETFQAMMEGYKATNPNAPIKEKITLREQLIAPKGTEEFQKDYSAKWDSNKARLLAEGAASGKYPDVEFSKLTPNQQEEIAEAAEEPVIREWIDYPESPMAKNFPPRIPAATFAVLFDRRHGRMAEKLNDGSEIDLFHNTHKTATEPFLTSGVLIRVSDGLRITKLEQIGGSLQILGNWESDTTTDKQGNPKTVVKISGQEYSLDSEVYKTLLEEGQERQAARYEKKAYATPASIEIDGPGNDLLIKNENGERSLRSYLPEGWKFRRGMYNDIVIEGNSVNYVTKIITFKKWGEASVNGRLSILHEMGHVMNLPKDATERPSSLEEREINFLLRNGEGDTFNYNLLKREHTFEEISSWSDRERKEKIKKIISQNPELQAQCESHLTGQYKNEREAWYQALQLLRKIKRDGFDLTEGKGLGDMSDQIHKKLGSYEVGLIDELRAYGIQGSRLEKLLTSKQKFSEKEIKDWSWTQDEFFSA